MAKAILEKSLQRQKICGTSESSQFNLFAHKQNEFAPLQKYNVNEKQQFVYLIRTLTERS